MADHSSAAPGSTRGSDGSPIEDDVYESARRWLDQHSHDAGDGATAGGERSLLNLLLEISLREQLRPLFPVPDSNRVKWAARLQVFQQAETGLFVETTVDRAAGSSSDSPLIGDPLSRVLTSMALQTLRNLDAHPAIEVRLLDRLDSTHALIAWLEERNWSEAAVSAEEVMCVLLVLVHQAEREGKEAAGGLFHAALDWLERLQDPVTGLFGSLDHNSAKSCLIATDRLLPFYMYVHRPVMRVARIIDTVLSVQWPGTALARPQDSARESLAGVNVLTLLGRLSNYRRADITEALTRTHLAICDAQRDDGTFLEKATADESAIVRHPAFADEGTSTAKLSSVWMRMLTLAIIEKRIDKDTSWRFQPWPGLGYHSSSGELTEHERRVLPLWIRPTAYGGGFATAPSSQAPVVTVVIPCYNLGRYLHEAVESVLAQTFQDLEIFVVDDGSTDEFTRVLLDQLERPRTTIIRQRNQGLAMARNNGIRAGTGRYFCCLDADDRLRPTFFSKAIDILDGDPGVGLTSGWLATFDDREEIVQVESCTLVDLLVSNPLVTPAVFRRQAWEKAGGYYPGFSSSGIEDWDLALTVLESGCRAEVIQEVVWDYRVFVDQMSTNMNPPVIWARLIDELVERHHDTYARHMRQAFKNLATQFAEMRAWAADRRWTANWWHTQAAIYRGISKRSDQQSIEYQTQIAWLQQQLAIAETERRVSDAEREAEVADLERQVSALEAARLSNRLRRLLSRVRESPSDRSE